MFRNIFSFAILGAVTLIAGAMSFAPQAQAYPVVYCTGPGVPVGCVVRPAVVYCTSPGFPVGCVARPAVVYCTSPGIPVGCVARRVYCTRPGYPVGCVDRGAPGVGVAPGVPGNRGGPVDRIGPR